MKIYLLATWFLTLASCTIFDGPRIGLNGDWFYRDEVD
jgi:hypothetical protein